MGRVRVGRVRGSGEVRGSRKWCWGAEEDGYLWGFKLVSDRRIVKGNVTYAEWDENEGGEEVNKLCSLYSFIH